MSHVFSLLSAHDCADIIQKTPEGHEYINWMDAHAVAIRYFPDYTFQFQTNDFGLDYFLMPDGSAYVSIVMTIAGETICTSLPVYKGDSTDLVYEPTANDLHNAKMRLRTRALGEFGLGYTLWTKDYESEETPVAKALQPEQPEVQKPDPRDAMWADVASAKTKSEAVAGAKIYRAAIQGANDLEDDSQARWKALCAERGWK